MVAVQDMLVTLEQLKTVCGVGLAHIHAWGSYERPRRICSIEARADLPMHVGQLEVTDAEDWIIHRIVMNDTVMIENPRLHPDRKYAAHALGLIWPFDVLRIDVEYVGLRDRRDFDASFRGRTFDLLGDASADFYFGGITAEGGQCIFLDLGDKIYWFEECAHNLATLAVAERSELVALEEAIAHGSPFAKETNAVVKRPAKPLAISLHACVTVLEHRERDDREATTYRYNPVLFGVDESTGRVVFDISDRWRDFKANCDFNGYVPSWWDSLKSPEPLW